MFKPCFYLKYYIIEYSAVGIPFEIHTIGTSSCDKF